MTAVPLLLLVALGSYLLGAVPFGYLIARARGVDILHQGSGNIGATNVGRILGLRFGVLVFLLDCAKGALPAALAHLVPQPSDVALYPNTLPVVAGVSAFVGHLFPVYLGFRGGKGVATGCGVIAVLVLPLVPFVLAAWALVLYLTRYVSLASLVAAALLVGLRLGVWPDPWGRDAIVVTVFCLVGCLLVFARHHANIRRLLTGTEPRLGSSHP